jgi:hypothetical protein
MRRGLTLLMAALVATACAASTTETEPPMSDRPSPAAATVPSPDPTLEPAPSPLPTPVPPPAQDAVAATLSIRWHADDPVGIDPQSEPLRDVVWSAGSFVAIGQLPYRDEETRPFAAWWSSDGRSWTVAQEFADHERILALVAGGPGFVATGFDEAGATAWMSVDGRNWQRVRDASLGTGVINQLVPTASGLVGFGWYRDSDAPGIWTSPDGLEWLAATNETGRAVAYGLQAVGAYDGRAIALVDQDDDRGGLAVFETTGRAEWKETGRFPTGSLNVHSIVGGPRGWVALGDNNLAWASRDGRKWSDADLGPDVASDVIADVSGFVAVGFVGSLPGDTCGDQRPFAGHTWTSADGTNWEQMPVTKGFQSAAITHLVVVDRTLVGYGLRIGDQAIDGGMSVGRWTAHLPEIATAAHEPDRGSHFESCGG